MPARLGAFACQTGSRGKGWLNYAENIFISFGLHFLPPHPEALSGSRFGVWAFGCVSKCVCVCVFMNSSGVGCEISKRGRGGVRWSGTGRMAKLGESVESISEQQEKKKKGKVSSRGISSLHMASIRSKGLSLWVVSWNAEITRWMALLRVLKA